LKEREKEGCKGVVEGVKVVRRRVIWKVGNVGE
jgi:hypothetical protein